MNYQVIISDNEYILQRGIYKLNEIVLPSFLPSLPPSTAQLRPWPPPQNPAEFLGGFSTIFFFTG
jgi:hypothetical protein